MKTDYQRPRKKLDIRTEISKDRTKAQKDKDLRKELNEEFQKTEEIRSRITLLIEIREECFP